MSRVENKHRLTKTLTLALREACAIVVWLLIVIKLVVFDVDVYFVQSYAQPLRWFLEYRLFVIAAAIALLWLFLGHSRFLKFIAYVMGYPLIILFWKIPKLMFKNWALLIVFTPAIHEVVSTLRSSFIVQSFAALSGVLIITSNHRYLLGASMVMLALFLAIHLYRSFRAAYRSSFFYCSIWGDSQV